MADKILDWPAQPCPLQEYNDQALRHIERWDDYIELDCLLDEKGLTEICQNDHSHGLLHAAARASAYGCVSLLVERGWQIERRLYRRHEKAPPLAANPAFWAKFSSRFYINRGSLSTSNPVSPTDFAGHPDFFCPSVRAAIPDAGRIGPTPLEIACTEWEIKTVVTLLSKGADPLNTILPLYVRDIVDYSCSNPLRDVAGEVCETGLLVEVARRGLVTSFNLLQLIGATPDLHSFVSDEIPDMMFQSALDVGDIEMQIFTFENHFHGESVRCDLTDFDLTLHNCSKGHRHRRIRQIVERIVRADCHDGMHMTPSAIAHLLITAAENNCVPTMDFILDLCPGHDINTATLWGVTPIHQAARSSQEDTKALRYLLGRGADPNLAIVIEERAALSRDIFGPPADRSEVCMTTGHSHPGWINPGSYLAIGDTPLHTVAKVLGIPIEVRRERAKLLFQAGAEVNRRNVVGNTPLHSDALRRTSCKHELALMGLMPLLVQNGADLSSENDRGQTWTDLMQERIRDGKTRNRVEPVRLIECDLRDLNPEAAEWYRIKVHREGFTREDLPPISHINWMVRNRYNGGEHSRRWDNTTIPMTEDREKLQALERDRNPRARRAFKYRHDLAKLIEADLAYAGPFIVTSKAELQLYLFGGNGDEHWPHAYPGHEHGMPAPSIESMVESASRDLTAEELAVQDEVVLLWEKAYRSKPHLRGRSDSRGRFCGCHFKHYCRPLRARHTRWCDCVLGHTCGRKRDIFRSTSRGDASEDDDNEVIDDDSGETADSKAPAVDSSSDDESILGEIDLGGMFASDE